MSDRITGGHHFRTVRLRRLGWLGAVTLLGAALLVPGTAAAAFSSPKCGCSHTSTTSTSSTQTTSTETSDVSETTSTQSTETSEVSETTSTQSTETTETSDVSETTSTQGTTTTDETGGVGGETGTPEVTPPSTSSLPGSSGSSDGWRVILLALAGIAVLSLILLPGDRKRTPR
jgi:cytoskeletal protein RodZ